MLSVTLPPVRVLVAALLLAVGSVPVVAVAPAHAADRVIQLTADGPVPAIATVKAGDRIVFRNADPTFIHQVDEASNNWEFDCGPLAPFASCVAGTVTKPGEYLYEGVNLDDFTGKVVVPAPSAAPSPARSRAPSPASSPAAQPGDPSPAAEPSPTGGTGAAGGPLFGGGLPSPAPTAGNPAPAVAPVLPGGEEVAPSPQPSGPVVAVQAGRLPEPATARRYGLPAALAAVAAAGVGSLLVRLLLAHPAARRRSGGPGPAVTVD